MLNLADRPSPSPSAQKDALGEIERLDRELARRFAATVAGIVAEGIEFIPIG